jgi:thiol-disulfide isomerase/thioredoxin
MKHVILTLVIVLTPTAAAAQQKQVPTVTLRDMNGRPFSLTDYKGKLVLLNFWATWCIPCRTEIPDLIKLQRQYRGPGLRIIGITYPPEKISRVRRVTRSLGINYRVAIGTKPFKRFFDSSETLPITVVVDREGTVRDVIVGIMYSDEFDEKVKPLLLNKR